MSELRDRIQGGAAAFYDAISDNFWEEHGINHDEAEKGLIAAMLHLGLLRKSEADAVRAEIKAEEDAESERIRAEAKARYDAMTPDMKEMHDSMRLNEMRMMQMQIRYLEKMVFGSVPAYAKIIAGPNDSVEPYGGTS